MKRVLTMLGFAIGAYAPLVGLVLWMASPDSKAWFWVIGGGHTFFPLFFPVLVVSALLADRVHGKPSKP